MQPGQFPPLRLALALTAIALLLAACASAPPAAPGEAGEGADARGQSPSTTEEAPAAEFILSRSEDENISEGNLEIRSEPHRARIFIDGRELGETPLRIDLSRGSYRVAAEKELHYRAEEWIDIRNPEELTELRIRLAEKSATLAPELEPADSRLLLGGTELEELPARVPAGRYRLRAERFGYLPVERSLTLPPGETLSPRITLRAAPLSLSGLRVTPQPFNPLDPGALGRLSIRFTLSAPADLRLAITAPDGCSVHRADYTVESGPAQLLHWEPAVSPATALPEGPYRLTVTARARGNDQVATTAVTFDLQRSGRATLRRNPLGGAPGSLLLTPTALPPRGGSAHVAYAALAGPFPPSEATGRPRLPQLLSGGWSPAERHHLSLLAGVEPNGTEAPGFAGGAAYSLLLHAGGEGGGPALSAALCAGYGRYSSSLHLPGRFSGAHLGPAFTLHGPREAPGRLSLSLAPRLLFTFLQPPPRGRVVLRAGADYEAPDWQAGLSAAMRSSRFGTGFTLELPLALAAEFQTAIPGSATALSFVLLGEVGTGSPSFTAGLAVEYLFATRTARELF
jgi:hypothetical protein